MKKILNHKLSALVLAGVLVVSIFTLFFAASISYKQIQSLSESEELILHSYKIKIELAQLLSYIKDAESSERAFILTNDSVFMHSYSDAANNVKKSFVKLKLLVFDNTEQSQTLDSLFFLINQRISFLESVLSHHANQGATSDSFTKSLARGRELMKNIEMEADKIAAYELNLLKQHERDLERGLNLSPLTIWFIVFFSLVFFILAYFRINRDIKMLARSNNQLLINKEIFEYSEQIAHINIWWWNMNENTFGFSPNLYRLLGCIPDEFEPTLENFIEFVHLDDRYLIWEESKRVVEDLGPSVIFYRVLRKDGDLRHFKSSWKVIIDNYGKTFIIGVNADITEQYNKDKMIGDKIADLEKSNKELSAFNHIASHDLQEPLRKVQIFISRIREKDFESFNENVKEYFAGIERATTLMQMFIDDLLLYSRASNVAKVFELTDLNVILENARQELSQRIREKNVMIRQSSLLPTLKVIPFQIQQLFNNLLSNSIKYSKPRVAPVITVDTQLVYAADLPSWARNAEHKYYQFSISDNGIGFDPKYARDIFKLFYRLQNNSEYAGTGIGLAICKVIVENHKGFIHAESTPNLGSTITFYLPVTG